MKYEIVIDNMQFQAPNSFALVSLDLSIRTFLSCNIFICLSGLLASYGAFCVAADNLAPFITQLDALLIKRFSINFQLLNKYLFQTCLYADSFVQNNVPLYISQVS